jgi:hypothetical protein
MATNVGYISNTSGTNFVILTNGEIVRRVDSSWNKIRVGVRMAWKEIASSDTGPTTPSNLYGTPRLYVGMCNYNHGGVGSMNSAMHFVGWRTASVTFSRTATGGPNANVPYYQPTIQAVKREANTFTAGTSAASIITPIFAPSNYAMFSVDIDKSVPATTVVSAFTPSNSNSGNVNITAAQFLSAMESVVPAITGYVVVTTAPMSINEGTNGVLDAVNIYWSRSRCTAYVTDIWYSILA